MSDTLRFVWRGAAGGAICPVLLFTYFAILPYGIAMVFYLVFAIHYVVIPGAIVGLVLGFCAHENSEMPWTKRLLVGAATGSIICVLWSLFASIDNHGSVARLDILKAIGWTVCYGTLTGGPAGLFSPSRLQAVDDSRPDNSAESRYRFVGRD